jgi:hypothetical protein
MKLDTEKSTELVKGMRQLENKNVVVDFQSKNKTWTNLGVPEKIIHNLEDLKMDRPAII